MKIRSLIWISSLEILLVDDTSTYSRRLATVNSDRNGEDEDVAAAVLFLAGPRGCFFNEQTLFMDGGSTLIKPAAK